MKNLNRNINRKSKNYFVVLAICICSAFFLNSCESSSLEIFANEDGQSDVLFSVNFGNAFMKTVLSMMNVNLPAQDSAEDVPIELFDTNEFATQLSDVGLQKVSVFAPRENALQITATLPEKDKDFFSSSGLIVCDGSAKKLSFTLSPEIMQAVYAELPEITKNYIDLFMAPVFTGEEMTHGEYVSLIASVFGLELAQEISNAKLEIKLFAPNKKMQKSFSVSLVEIFTMQSNSQTTAKSFSIAW